MDWTLWLSFSLLETAPVDHESSLLKQHANPHDAQEACFLKEDVITIKT